MYRPPENRNRVKSIKSRFENAENKDIHLKKNGIRSDLNNRNKNDNAVNVLTQNLSRQLSDPSRRNIKRTPAFRIDVNSEKNSLFERNVSYNRSFYFEKIQKFNTALKNNCDTNEKVNNTTENLSSNSNVIKNEEPMTKENCSKPALIKSKSSLDFTLLRSKFDGTIEEDQNNINKIEIVQRKNDKIANAKNVSCVYTEPVPKALRNKIQTGETTETSEIINNEIYNAKICDPKQETDTDNNIHEISPPVGLTDTLKAALKRPLPKGPAPQKPPRTFEHFPVNDVIDAPKNTSFLYFHNRKQDEKVNNNKVKYKHDPRYMLNKLENALRNNKIRTRKQVKVETSTTSGEDSDDSVLCKSHSQRQLPSLPNLSPDSQSFNFNCLNGLTICKTTYETIREPNSSFFVSCQPEPVYAEPFNFSQDAHKFEAATNFKNSQQSAKSLYYMSTSLLYNEGSNGSSIDENLKQLGFREVTRARKDTIAKQMSADDSSQSSAMSDIGSAVSTPLDDDKDSFETSVKIKQLIDTFETKKETNAPKKDSQVCMSSDGSHRIEELKLSLQRTIEKCFDHETKDSSDEQHSREKKVSVDRIINKFQTYVKTMPKYQKPKLSQDDRLFCCCLVVGWDKEKPQIKFKYPTHVKIPNRIEDLCYPETVSGPLDSSNNAQCYSLVITNDKGERTFGYCRRVIPEGSTKCIPIAYCILSKQRAPRFYKKILTELESRHGIPDKLRDELISKFYHNKFPRPGESVKIDLTNFPGDFYLFKNELPCHQKLQDSAGNPELRHSCDLTSFVHVSIKGEYVTESEGVLSSSPTVAENNKTMELTLTLHHDTRYEEADLKPLHKLPPHILLKIFASLLLERKVILISCVISKLSCCVDALQSILYPFSWPHTFIPILPQSLWDVVESPTPVICGVLSLSVVNNHKIEHGIVVDLDEGNIISEEGDEDSILSDSMKKAWNQGLSLANTVPPDDYVHSVYLSDAYIKVLIVSLKHYKSHIISNTFEKEAFIQKAKTKGIRRFLKWFTETTMFISFIESVINNPESFSLFDKKIEMYGSDESNLILTKLLEWKKM